MSLVRFALRWLPLIIVGGLIGRCTLQAATLPTYQDDWGNRRAAKSLYVAQRNLSDAQEILDKDKRLDPSEAQLLRSRMPQAQRALDAFQPYAEQMEASQREVLEPLLGLVDRAPWLEKLRVDEIVRTRLLQVGIGYWLLARGGYGMLREHAALQEGSVQAQRVLYPALKAVGDRLNDESARCECRCAGEGAGSAMLKRGRMNAEDCKDTCRSEGLAISFCQ